MDIRNKFEVYIPKEAEITTILLWSLPNSLLNRLGLPCPVSEGSRKSSASPSCTWISPVVIRSKDKARNYDTGDAVKRSMASLVQSKPTSDPVQMPFVSENSMAYQLLSDILPNARCLRNTNTNSTIPSRQNSRTHTNQDGVIIYRRQVYLSIKNVKRVAPYASKGRVKHPNRDSDTSATRSLLMHSRPASAHPASFESQKTGEGCSLGLGVCSSESDGGSTDIGEANLLDIETKGSLPMEHQTEGSNNCEAAAVSPIIISDDDIPDLQKPDIVCHADTPTPVTHSFNNVSRVRNMYQQPFNFTAQDYQELANDEKIAKMKAEYRESQAALDNLKLN